MSLLNGAGTDLYYQGSVGERMIIHEGNKYGPNNAWGQRELGVPYLKRGFAQEAYKYYNKAIIADPEEWAGYMAYCWLYFYRDYKTALKLIEQCDVFTPDFVDYPQSTSVNYMRGICFLQMGEFENAIKYLDMHLNHEAASVTHEYIDAPAYYLLGLAHHRNRDFEKADSIYLLGLEHNRNSSELYFYCAKNKIAMKHLDEAKSYHSKAQDWHSKGGTSYRPYVEEFYTIYQEDLNEMKLELDFSK